MAAIERPDKEDKHVNVREKMQEITKGCKSKTDLDALISRHGGTLGGLYRAEFAGCDVSEVAYEWDNIKLNIKRETR
jgi:hypothetical protein